MKPVSVFPKATVHYIHHILLPHAISMSSIQPLAWRQKRNPYASMARLHFSTAAGLLGFYDEGEKQNTSFSSVFGFVPFIHPFPCFSLTLLAFIGLLSSTQDDYHKGFPFFEQKRHSHKSWMPFPQNIPDMKAINLMRTTSPKEVCGDLSISLDHTANDSGLCPRSGMLLHTGGFVAGTHGH